ncbi:hypothetical protein [Pseudofulvibacter geojedonensis]|uniref:SRPBCC family protein n=1 Tax=Pseudofulvibacter geojedonensis TaxID=1123758 RepID=A0ABW3I4K1_9FLAO
MSFIKGYLTKHISNSIYLESDKESIWKEITNVMVADFNFPKLFKLLGIPKPLSAQVIKEGIGGYRVASFSNKAQFRQTILEWELHKKYRFKFSPTKNFRVAHILNLQKGPFQILTGGYEILNNKNEIKLVLSSNYKLNGTIGKIMHLPFRFIVYLFQRHLLKGIKRNLSVKVSSA